MSYVTVFDSDGKYAGQVEIPTEIVQAAHRVAYWMHRNKCVELCGLRFEPYTARGLTGGMTTTA